MLKNFFNKLNTVITIAGAVYTVSKFMYDTFKKYEANHNKKNDRGKLEATVSKGHENLQEIPEG